jgi:hypothetical protein
MYKIRIYKIVNDIDDKIYVGSTKQTLAKRWGDHIKSYNNGHLQEKSKVLFKSHAVDNCHIVLIKTYKVESKEEQLKHERKHYNELKPYIVNVCRPHVSKAEWKEYYTKYRHNHLDQMKACKVTYRSKQRQHHCICGGSCRWEDKSRHLKQKHHIAFMEKYNSNDPEQLFECSKLLRKQFIKKYKDFC